MEIISEINAAVYGIVGGVPMIAVLLITGIFCTILLRGIQFRKFGYSFKTTFSKKKGGAKENTLTPFQALCTALASTVGTGNIAGVAGAISLGGPGAIFWIWIAAVLGMATKYSEIVLALRYREKKANGEWVGGPMYYIKNGLGKHWKWIGHFFCGCCAVAAFGTGNMAQINTITATATSVIDYFAPAAASYDFAIKLGLGIAVAVSAVLVLFGGITRIGKVTEKLTPFMSGLYIGGALLVVAFNWRALGDVLLLIVKSAFNPTAFGGGLVGITIIKTVETGIGKGIFSNEAGLGSAPIAHATADNDEPVKQGMLGIFEVFVTIVISSITAFAILSSGVAVDYGTTAGAALTTSAFATVIGEGPARIFMAVAICMFGLSTIYGWVIYGVRSIEFLCGPKAIIVYKILYIGVIVLGAIARIDLVWALCDTFNCLMAIPNLVAVLLLSGEVSKLTRNFFGEKRKEHKKLGSPLPAGKKLTAFMSNIVK